MSKYEVKVIAVNNTTVQGTCDGVDFEAVPFRWGGKMLMKVVADNSFSQGQKVAIGGAAKKALRSAEIELPKAELVRPRKPKAEEIVEAVAEQVVDPVAVEAEAVEA